MLYDDVDVNIVDSNDSFGVLKVTDVAKHSQAKNVSKKTPGKRGNAESKSQSKFAKKTEPEAVLYAGDDLFGKKTQPEGVVSVDFRNKAAVTFKDKLAVLEDRDKHLRETVFKNTSKNMNVIVVGTCPDMCPEKERLLREIHCSFSVFEGQIVQNEMLVVPELLVKEYSRSSADQDEPLPHELRPEPVLLDTMTHILGTIVPKIDDNEIDLGEWYHFCWDRLRSLRKDIIQQQLCSKRIVQILEQSARFHICCADRLFDADRRVFDEKINAENLVNCLQMLMNMYEDLAAIGEHCENETEFRVYMMLLLLNNGEVPDVIRWNEEDEAAAKHVSDVVEIFIAFKMKFYTKFFKLVKRTGYLNACILQRYFGSIRTHILQLLANSYSSGSKMARFPIKFVRRVLEFNSAEDTVAFVESHGFTVDYDVGEIRGSKATFTVPDMRPTCQSSNILIEKRLPILEAITGNADFVFQGRQSRVHSSFDEYDLLKNEAWNANDQRDRVVELYGNIYEEVAQELMPPQESSPKITASTFTFSLPPRVVEEAVPATSEPKPTFNFSMFRKQETVSKPENVFTIGKSSVPNSPPKPISATFAFPKIPSSEAPVELVKPVVHSIPPAVIEPVFDAGGTESDTSALYDPEEEYESPVDESESSQRGSPLPETHKVSTRKSEELVLSLSKIINEFQDRYSSHSTAVVAEPVILKPLSTVKVNRKLRKVVRRRLKQKNAQKFARLWRKKVEKRKHNRENFVGIVHLPADEYFRLWGVLKESAGPIARNVVAEVVDSQNTLSWSSRLLRNDPVSVKYVGSKLAETLVRNSRAHCARLRVKVGPVICWKILVSLPQSNVDGYRSFVSKIKEFCRILFYEAKNELGCVQVTQSAAVRVCSSINVTTGAVDERDAVVGLTSVLAVVHDTWDTVRDFEERLSSILRTDLACPVFLNIIFIGEHSFKSETTAFLTRLQQTRTIAGFAFTKWRNFFTIPKVVLEACRHIPPTPSCDVKSLPAFVESVSGDFFLNLYCMPIEQRVENTPLAYIKLYNELLCSLKRVLAEESCRKYNLSPEFLPHVVGEQNSRNNLADESVLAQLERYALVNFTKWPPKSIRKMGKLLTEYCRNLDAENTLLPNVLRLLDARQEETNVQEISDHAPWLKIVELWFRYNWQSVSKGPEARNSFVFYDERRIEDVVEGLWMRKHFRAIGAGIDPR